jgi:hypothetical protein
MSTDDLIGIYDATARSTQIGLDFVRDEIARRDAAAQTDQIARMTMQMRDLTVWVTVLTGVNVVLAFAAVVVSLKALP